MSDNSGQPEHPDYAKLAEHAAQLAQGAGKLIQQLRENGVQVAAVKSSSVDIVTAADKAAEEYLVSQLSARFPAHGILGEEGTLVNPDAEITWVLDPIDGTVNYFYDLPGYCVSVAACVRDDSFAEGYHAVAGAVYVPKTDELFMAAKGHGATLNGRKLKCSEAQELSGALVATGFGYTATRRAAQANVLPELLPQVRDIRRSGAAAYDLCLIAAGRLDGYYEGGLKPWDYASGSIIATEAGATLSGSELADGKPGTPLIVAGSKAVVTALKAIVDPQAAFLRTDNCANDTVRGTAMQVEQPTYESVLG